MAAAITWMLTQFKPIETVIVLSNGHPIAVGR
jgi:hypothetical protein